MIARLKVDYTKCTKSGECYYNHHTLFKRQPDGLPLLLVEELTTDSLRTEAEQAVEVCPEGAISIEEG